MRVRVLYKYAEFEIDFDIDEDDVSILLAQVQSKVGTDLELEAIDTSGRLIKDVGVDLSRLYVDAGADTVSLICIEKSAVSSFCSGAEDEEQYIQPFDIIEGTPILLCTQCSSTKLSSSLTSRVRYLMLGRCQCKMASDIGLLYAGQNGHGRGQRVVTKENDVVATYVDSVRNFRRIQLYAAALQQQMTHGQEARRRAQEFSARLDSGVRTVMVYEEADHQAAARKAINYAKIKDEADKYAAEAPDSAEDVRFVVGLIRWFKKDFFKWCTKPACEHDECQAHSSRLVFVRTESPNSEETSVGWASRVEVYKCGECERLTRFARFNNPSHLLQTRTGRCGEWANAFCLLCRALSLDARYVLDFTDHVWAEVYVPSMKRFVHCDPCERTFDAPLCYETGWKKELTHVIAFSRYGVSDASPRYSRKMQEVIIRRGAGVKPGELREVDAQTAIAYKDKQVEDKFCDAQQAGYLRGTSKSRPRGTFASDTLSLLASRSRLDSGEAGFIALGMLELRLEDMQKRKADDRWEISGLIFSQSGPDKQAELRGRGSGDKEWREQRGELGDGKGGDEDSPPCLLGVALLLRNATPQKISYPPSIATKLIFSSLGATEKLEIIVSAMVASSIEGGEGGHIVEKYIDQANSDAWHCATTGLSIEELSWIPILDGQRFAFDLNYSVHTRIRYVPSASHVASLLANDSFSVVEGFWQCKYPMRIVSKASEDEDDAAFLSRLQTETIAAKSCLGFILSGRTAVLFGPSGVPQSVKEPKLGSQKFLCYLKRTTLPQDSGASKSEDTCSISEMLRYLPLSGSRHGDTKPIDTTSAVSSAAVFAEMNNKEPVSWHELRVCEIHVWASNNFVNGLQLVYEKESEGPRVFSPKFLGDGGPEASQQFLSIPKGDEIVKIEVRAGAIVDSITITTKTGNVLKAGGIGGGPPAVLELGEGSTMVGDARFVGLFGGLGGHIHNLGAVLLTKPPPPSTVPTQPSAETVTAAAIFDPVKRNFAQFYSCVCRDRVDLIQWAEGDQRMLERTLRAIHQLQHSALLNDIADCIIRFHAPLAADPSNEATREVEFCNIDFVNNVLAHGGEEAGLTLFCSGPGQFYAENLTMKSGIRLFHEGGSTGRGEVTKAIQNFIQFLQYAKEVL